MTPPPDRTAPPSLSYELYPPRCAASADILLRTLDELEPTRPDHVSVTYSGDEDRRSRSLALLDHLLARTGLRPLAHLTCVGAARTELEETVTTLIRRGVRGVLALRGDLPEDPAANRGELSFATELVELVREVERRHTATLAAGRLAVGVAAYPTRHPESPSARHDVEVLLAKQRSGADFAITQVYFRPERYERLVAAARAAGVTIPIVPGIMPVTDPRRLRTLCRLAGLEPDPDLAAALENASGPAERHRAGVGFATALSRAALDAGAPGLHLYTFNEHRAALDLLERVDLPRPRPEPAPALLTA
ncbi:methylenetetrahydrofolate reductase [Kocuria sp.]|uniref:methylenetetrahydrofolate reductase n=1 Tax=Kocuria sp. TaxID=1871328 RepID=UPI002810D188|nr:methylenetetrahydrofolate reductase [Kocuria sp.]